MEGIVALIVIAGLILICLVVGFTGLVASFITAHEMLGPLGVFAYIILWCFFPVVMAVVTVVMGILAMLADT